MVKRSWNERRSDEAVSPVIATILLVGITVVLAATLYVMVFGFGGSSSNSPPIANFTLSNIEGGIKVLFTPFSKDTVWSDISIVLAAETSTASFDNFTTESLTSDLGTKTVSLGSRELGSLDVFMNVTDLGGNGYINQGDFLSVTTSGGSFSNAVTYELFLMHGPTGSVIASKTFQGA